MVGEAVTQPVSSTMQDDFPLTVPAILRHAQELHGDAVIAVRTDDGIEHLTLDACAERIHRLTGAIVDWGVRPGDRVGTLSWNTLPHLEAYFAVPAAGAVLHTINVRLFADQVAHIVAEAADRVLLVDSSLWDVVVAVLPQCPTVELVVLSDLEAVDTSGTEVPVVGYEDFIATARPVVADVSDERSPAAMCYTSGTTGSPKGVVYSHRSVYLHAAANLYAGGFGISDRDVVLQVVPMFHANGWGFPYAAFLAGAGLVLPDRHLAPELLLPLVEAERPTVSGGVPTVWRGLMDHAREVGGDLTSLRLVSCAGSAVPESLIRDYVGLGIELYQAWGMTETSPLAAIARPPARDGGRDEWYWRSRTGRPVPGVEVRTVGEDGDVLPADGTSVGELEVRGPWVTASYHGGASADRFHDGWLRTGDVGTVDPAGAMKITDRAKDLIKSGGEWISSSDIEDRLTELEPVVDAACIGVPDPRWGERPLALVRLRREGVLTMASVKEHLGRSMARWQVPERVLSVAEIPRTSVGKIDKQALRTAHEDGGIQGDELPSG